MAVLVHIEAPKGSATASSAITDGEILTPIGAGTKVQHATANNQLCVGVAAEAAAAGEGLRIYLPGQIAKVRCGATLDAQNGIDDYKLTSNADGKAVKATAGNRSLLCGAHHQVKRLLMAISSRAVFLTTVG